MVKVHVKDGLEDARVSVTGGFKVFAWGRFAGDLVELIWGFVRLG